MNPLLYLSNLISLYLKIKLMKANVTYPFNKKGLYLKPIDKSNNTLTDNTSANDNKVSSGSEKRSNRSKNKSTNPLQMNISANLNVKVASNEYDKILADIHKDQKVGKNSFKNNMNCHVGNSYSSKNKAQINHNRHNTVKIDIFGHTPNKTSIAGDNVNNNFVRQEKRLSHFNDSPLDTDATYLFQDHANAKKVEKKHGKFELSNKHISEGLNTIAVAVTDKERHNQQIKTYSPIFNDEFFGTKTAKFQNQFSDKNYLTPSIEYLTEVNPNRQDIPANKECNIYLEMNKNQVRSHNGDVMQTPSTRNKKYPRHTYTRNDNIYDQLETNAQKNKQARALKTRNSFANVIFQNESANSRATNPLLSIYNSEYSNPVSKVESTNLYFKPGLKTSNDPKQLKVGEQFKRSIKSIGEKLLIFTSFSCRCDFISLDHRSKLIRMFKNKENHECTSTTKRQ